LPLFGPELLKRFHYLSLVAGRLGGSPLLATARCRLPAGGTEVTDYRDYVPGDDFYHIHWTWCARRDELLVKVFECDPPRYVYLLVDCSASMALGRPAKFQLARQIAAALGYVSLAAGDRLAAAALADTLVAELPTICHPARLVRLLRFLEGLSPDDARTCLARSAEMFVRRRPPPGQVIVLSDLYDPDGYRRAFELLCYHGHEPRLVHLFDPQEDNPGLLGDVELVEVESQAVRGATITERAALRYRALVAEFRRAVRDFCSRQGIVCMQLACDTPQDEALLRVLGGTRAKPSGTAATVGK
jgi:uncharacterized protein (DUF58 family)